jgi:hypothetical protein
MSEVVPDKLLEDVKNFLRRPEAYSASVYKRMTGWQLFIQFRDGSTEIETYSDGCS